MTPALRAVAISLGLFLGLVICVDTGYRIGRSSASRHPAQTHEGIGVIEAAIFALLGLLLAFTFAGASSRLDTKRQLIVQEANAIGTAYLRLDLLPANDQPELRHLFRNYLDARLRVYQALPDREVAGRELERVAQIQGAIWGKAVPACRAEPTGNATRLFLPALNEMIDITTTRTVALDTHLPPLILALLLGIALLSGLVAGYAMSKREKRSWLHAILYGLVIALATYATPPQF